MFNPINIFLHILIFVHTVFTWQKTLIEMLRPIDNFPSGCHAERSRSVYYKSILMFPRKELRHEDQIKCCCGVLEIRFFFEEQGLSFIGRVPSRCTLQSFWKIWMKIKYPFPKGISISIRSIYFGTPYKH